MKHTFPIKNPRKPSRHRLAICACPLALIAANGPAFGQNTPQDFYPQRIWEGTNGGEMHISGFVFRDINGNGLHDLGDRPFAHIAVQLTNPANVQAVAWSNISGFANFDASVAVPGAQITGPGVYGFHVVVPPGWRITTANADQQLPIEGLEGAPGDLIATKLPTSIGLAPMLEIRGNVGQSQPNASAGLLARDQNGGTFSVAPGSDGHFSFSAAPGEWSLKMPRSDSARRVSVSSYPVVLPTAQTDIAAGREPDRIGFDDLIGTEAVAKIPGGYGQLRWTNWVVTHNRTYAGEGYINGTVSGEYVAYNSSGHPASIESDIPFDFAGGHFTLAWANAEGETLRLRAWQGDTIKYEDDFPLSALGPVFFDAGYRDITRLEISTGHYWQVVVDDLLVRRGSGSPGH